MSIKRGGNIDYQQNQILNVVIQNLSSAPSSPKAGQVYYDTTLTEFGYYNGSAWIYSNTTAPATGTSLGTVELAGDLAGTGSTATAPTVGNLHLTGTTNIGQRLTGGVAAVNPTDIPIYSQITSAIAGLNWKAPVAAVTYSALPAYTQSGSGATGTLTANASGALTVDGYAVQLGDRILVTQPTAIQPDGTTGGGAAAAKDAGIYTVTTLGTSSVPFVLTRASDANTASELQDATTFGMQGTKNGDVQWNLSNAPGFTVDTTALTWVIIQNGTVITADGVYLQRTANTIGPKTATTPTAPAAGAVSTANPGFTRLVKFALTSDGTTTTYSLTHNLNTYQLGGAGQINSGGNPGTPIELDWTPTSANAVQITFPTAPTSGTTYFFTVMG